MAIKAILDILNSNRDRNGNCYWAFRYTDCKTGRQVCAQTTGGESNISAVFNHEKWNGWGWGAIYTTRHSLGIREFNSLTAKWPHAGCDTDDIGNYIKVGLKAKR